MSRTRLLCHLLLLALPFTSQAANAPLEILDTRVSVQPATTCGVTRHVVFDGHDDLIKANAVVSADGVPQVQTEDPILDAAWRDGHDYVLTTRDLLIIDSGTRQTIKVRLPAQSSEGQLLATSPAFVSFGVSRGHTGAIIGLTAKSLQVVAVESHYSTSAIDLAGNILVAADTDLYAISRAGRRVPLLRIHATHIRSVHVLPDNSLLIGTNKGLLKLASNRHVYALLSGGGELRQVADEWTWCSSSTNNAFTLHGLELPGNPESDKQEVTRLLKQVGDDISSHKIQAAHRAALQALQILPQDPALQELTSKLRHALQRGEAAATKSASAS